MARAHNRQRVTFRKRPGERLPEPRRHPRQRRSRELVGAIEQACLGILEREGPDALTTHRIAEVAGVNVGSLYQYFPNKEAVVARAYEARMVAEAERIVRLSPEIEALASRSLEETLRRVIDLEADLHLRYLRLNAEFYAKFHRELDLTARIDEHVVAHRQPSWEEWFPTLLARHRDRLRDTDLELAAFVVTRALGGVLEATVEDRPELLESEAFREQLLALLLRFLLKDER